MCNKLLREAAAARISSVLFISKRLVKSSVDDTLVMKCEISKMGLANKVENLIATMMANNTTTTKITMPDNQSVVESS